MFWIKTNFVLIGLYGGIEIILQVYKWYENRSKRNTINEVLFTSDKSCCELRPSRIPDCPKKYCYYYNLQKMQSFINGAKHSIFLCMNIFTNLDLGRAILKAHERGIHIQIVANETTAYASGSQLKMLHQNGVPVRIQNTQNYVHHKFCLLDTYKSKEKKKNLTKEDQPEGARDLPKNGVVLTGSMNWTLQAMNNNWENVLITSDRKLVDSFHQEFLKMWNHPYIVAFDGGEKV